MPSTRNMMMDGLLFLVGLALTTVACVSLLGAAPSAVPTAGPPSPTARPTETAMPLYQQVAISATNTREEGQPQAYTINAESPVLVGSEDPRVKAFNEEVKSLVDNAITAFKQNVATIPASPYSTVSTFELKYNVVSPPGDIYSILFNIQTFYTGAAHPGDTSQTLNFDLQRGAELKLADLFQPNSNYLDAIANYCIAQLKTRDIGFDGFELGATATPENYRNWNITADGLMITFDEYQVAPYAAGPQTVVIPYSALAQIILPDGPLTAYMH